MKYIFSFDVSESLARVVHVRAENEEEAWEKISELYCEGEILLTEEDWVEGSGNYDLLPEDSYREGEPVID